MDASLEKITKLLDREKIPYILDDSKESLTANTQHGFPFRITPVQNAAVSLATAFNKDTQKYYLTKANEKKLRREINNLNLKHRFAKVTNVDFVFAASHVFFVDDDINESHFLYHLKNYISDINEIYLLYFSELKKLYSVRGKKNEECGK